MRKLFCFLAIALHFGLITACQSAPIESSSPSSTAEKPSDVAGEKPDSAIIPASSPQASKPIEASGDQSEQSMDVYVSANYTVTIRGFGGDASYEGCNAQNQCLTIAAASSATQGQYIWENGNYTYSMTPIDSTTGQYRLTVLDKNQTAIVKEILTPFENYQGCLATPPVNFVSLLGENRLAKSSDFMPDFQKSCKLLKLDFNGDQLADYAFFSVPQNKPNIFYLNFAVAQADGNYDAVRYDHTNKQVKKSGGLIYTAIELKPSGKAGLADRKYSPLTPEEAQVYTAATSVEFFGVISETGMSEEPQFYDMDSLMYCSTGQYFVADAFKSFHVCD